MQHIGINSDLIDCQDYFSSLGLCKLEEWIELGTGLEFEQVLLVGRSPLDSVQITRDLSILMSNSYPGKIYCFANTSTANEKIGREE